MVVRCMCVPCGVHALYRGVIPIYSAAEETPIAGSFRLLRVLETATIR